MTKYFGTDGIRGFANKTLTVDTVYNIGRFIGNYYQKEKRILIGKDTRLSSDMFEAALCAGISASGCDAYLLGYCTTPALAYVTKNEKFAIGVMISASHNPYHDNGIKIFGNDGIKINEEIELKIEKYIDDPTSLSLETDEKIGRVIEYKKGLTNYCEHLIKLFNDKLPKQKIILDLANGGSCFSAKKIFNELFLDVNFINDNPNGININSKCGSTHLESLKEAIKTNNYDIGFAYDGDADRVLCLDSQGQLVDGDKIMFILAKHLKNKNKLKDNLLVTTVMSNIGLFKSLDKENIKSLVVDVGDKNVLDAMTKNGYSLGGEQSGHIINNHYTNFGDGVLTSLMILEVLKETGKTIKELASEVNIYPQILKNYKVKDKNALMKDENILNKIKEVQDKLGNEGRVLVRPSGTEPLLRIMVEAKTLDLCQNCIDEIAKMIE